MNYFLPHVLKPKNVHKDERDLLFLYSSFLMHNSSSPDNNLHFCIIYTRGSECPSSLQFVANLLTMYPGKQGFPGIPSFPGIP